MNEVSHHSEGRGIKIGYLILTHKYPEQVLRLINRLDYAYAQFVIHVDKSADDSIYQSLYMSLHQKQNVHFTKRYTCNWGGYGITQAMLQGIWDVIEKPIPIDYLVLLSGQDYPVKPRAYIHKFIASHPKMSFVDLNPFPFADWKRERGGWERVEAWYFIGATKAYKIPNQAFFETGRWQFLNPWLHRFFTLFVIKRKYPYPFQLFGGSQFWILSKDHLQYVHEFSRKHKNFIRFFKHVLISDEILIQTIMGNATFQDEIHLGNLTLIEWHNGFPKIYTEADKEILLNTPRLFARKFDATADSTILDWIDQELLLSPMANLSR